MMKTIGILIAFVVAVTVASMLVFSAFLANEAERNLQAFTGATFAISEFVDREGRWPGTMDELKSEKYFVDRESEILKRVKIAWDVPLDDVAACSPENFPYIVGSLPTFPSAVHERVQLVISGAKARMPPDAEPPRTEALMP
jgi:hypothetical protein